MKLNELHLPHFDLSTKDGRRVTLLLYGALPLLLLILVISFFALYPGVVGNAGSHNSSGPSAGDSDSGSAKEQTSLTPAQKDFDTYLNTIFATQAADSTLSEHFMIADPTYYGIREKEATWGPAMLLELRDADTEAKILFERLESYAYNELTDEQKICYQLIENVASHMAESENSYLYDSVFSPTVGVQAQIPVLLAEYAFDSTADIENYLSLIELLPEYFMSLLTLQQERISFGIPLPITLAERVVAQCESVSSQGNDCFLLEIFEQKIYDFSNDVATLSETQIANYTERHELLILNSYLPAYRLLADNLASYASAKASVLGLAHYDGGKEYYEAFAQSELGTTRTMQEYISMTELQIENDLQEVYLLLAGDSTLPEALLKVDELLADGSPEECLTLLSEAMLTDFPAPADNKFSIKYVHSALEPFLSPAFYMIPQIDADASNIIYLNQSRMTSGETLLSTLAHEGFPGHLYQTVTFYETNPHPVRQLYSCNGYVEGWATYVEMISYDYMGLPKNLAELLRRNASFSLGLYARIDMGVNYDGWQKADVVGFLESYGISSDDYADEIYYTMVEEPGNYLKYYLGYLEILELRKTALAIDGDDFSLKEFHATLLEMGPLPFEMLEEIILSQ
ncbi:MAG: DUF885 domain-containing protein [Lachnospiraceae bacterium]|nr:DUF885 domain-containing protein [Lachnospiraceae bacterium]